MSKLGVVEDTLFVPMLGRIYAAEHCPQILYDKLFRDFLIIFANVVKCRNSPVLRAFPAFSVSEDTPHISAFFSLTLPPKVVKME